MIVVPLGNSNQLPKDTMPDDFFKEVRRRREVDSGKEEPYIAAKFGKSELPKRFNVGDENFKNRYGYYNKELTKGIYYTMFTRAYVKSNQGVCCDVLLSICFRNVPYLPPRKGYFLSPLPLDTTGNSRLASYFPLNVLALGSPPSPPPPPGISISAMGWRGRGLAVV